MAQLTLAIPSKGRLKDDCHAYFADAGAALRLVPSRFQDWNIRRRNGERHDVELCIPSHEVHGMGHTLPLAICAASLRALAEEASDGE